MAFEKFTGKPTKRGRPSPLPELKVGEIAYLPEPYSKKLYVRIGMIQRKTGRTFEWQACINGGVVVRRAT